MYTLKQALIDDLTAVVADADWRQAFAVIEELQDYTDVYVPPGYWEPNGSDGAWLLGYVVRSVEVYGLYEAFRELRIYGLETTLKRGLLSNKVVTREISRKIKSARDLLEALTELEPIRG
jgi:hypothetical protein